MRIELAGSFVKPKPLILKFDSDLTFVPLDYINLGYTSFDVICIGAGGGRGGQIDTQNTGTLIKNYGGEGGGGGFHRINGFLELLPASCPVVIGAAGNPGTDHASNPANTTDGTDGGYSSFNGSACRASGGKGGKRVQTNSDTVRTLADGGEGGLGDRTTAGGGAAGGVAGIPTADGPGTLGTNGIDGTFVNNIGEGGGGGAGGVSKYTGQSGMFTICNPGTMGGRGSYNPADLSVYGWDPDPTEHSNQVLDAVPGKAGGARGTPLNGLPTVYGYSDNDGIVILRLTAELGVALKTELNAEFTTINVE